MKETTVQVREPYEEPMIEDVPLQAEEMLANCKGDHLHAGSGLSTTCRTPGGVSCKSS